MSDFGWACVASALSRLARKIDDLTARLEDEGVHVENVLAPPRRDVRVHDAHSEGDEFQSVTARSTL